MKVMIFNLFYYPNMFGGAEHSVKILAESLLSRGHEVCVVTCDAKGRNETEEVRGVEVIRLQHRAIYDLNDFYLPRWQKVIRKIATPFVRAKIFLDIKGVLKRSQWDVIQINNLHWVSWRLWKYLKSRGQVVIQTLRDYSLMESSRFRFCNKALCKSASNKYVDAVSAPSEYTLSKYTTNGYFENSLKQTIVNAIDYNEPLLMRVIKDKISRSGKIRFLFAGRLSREKGLSILHKAWSSINCFDAELCICGDGPLKEMVEEWSSKDSRIKYLGKLSTEDLSAEYEKADVLIVPSLWDEPFGRVLIEGFQYALPVICSRVGGMQEIIERTGIGVLYSANDYRELRDALLQLCDRERIKDYFPKMRKACIHYSVQRQVKDFESLFIEAKNAVSKSVLR